MEVAIHQAACGPAPRGAVLFFGFEVAFPSLDREYLWFILGATGVPPPVLRAMRALNARIWHWLKLQPWPISA